MKGLVVGCPFGFGKEECPFKGLKDVPLERRLAIVESMDEEQINVYVDVNKYCAQGKSFHQHISRNHLETINRLS